MNNLPRRLLLTDIFQIVILNKTRHKSLNTSPVYEEGFMMSTA